MAHWRKFKGWIWFMILQREEMSPFVMGWKGTLDQFKLPIQRPVDYTSVKYHRCYYHHYCHIFFLHVPKRPWPPSERDLFDVLYNCNSSP
jgi:hypothetical protein